jgi:phage terminase large subunit
MSLDIALPDWGIEVAESTERYIVLYGGRGSGKSYLVADILILKAYSGHEIILCGREYQNDLSSSVHALLKLRIDAMGMSKHFIILENKIICKHNGSYFFFKGLKRNAEGLKSIPNITHLWIEEAATLSAESWRIIKPTVRLERSQIWITLNPKNKDDCLYKQFILDPEPKYSLVKEVNWNQNPFFTNVLEKERQIDLAGDADMYQHVWEGKPLQHSDSLIFKGKWIIDDFIEDDSIFAYYGLDFGFIDPTAAVRCYIKGNILYITHEFYKRQIEINEIGEACEAKIKGFKEAKVICDSAAPGQISFMRGQGYNVKGATKGKGTIEDGIAFLRSFDRIVVHPRCEYMVREFGLYSYKVDEHSGEVTNKIIDSNNHLIDALRYAVERLMKRNMANYAVLSKL